jgi:DNA-binding sugar fermentation-stimulating protein
MDLEESQESKPVAPEPKPSVPISSVQCKEIEDLISEHHVDKVRCLNWIIKLVQSKNNTTIAVLTQLPNTLFDEVLSKIPSFANTAN